MDGYGSSYAGAQGYDTEYNTPAEAEGFASEYEVPTDAAAYEDDSAANIASGLAEGTTTDAYNSDYPGAQSYETGVYIFSHFMVLLLLLLLYCGIVFQCYAVVSILVSMWYLICKQKKYDVWANVRTNGRKKKNINLMASFCSVQ
jgi:hypothetical protein